MIGKKVNYKSGKNIEFDFYVIEEKEELTKTDFKENLIAFQFEGNENVKISKFGQLVFGDYDFVVEKRKKGSDECYELILAHSRDLEIALD